MKFGFRKAWRNTNSFSPLIHFVPVFFSFAKVKLNISIIPLIFPAVRSFINDTIAACRTEEPEDDEAESEHSERLRTLGRIAARVELYDLALKGVTVE